MVNYRNYKEYDDEEFIEDIRRDYDRMSNIQRIMFADNIMDAKTFHDALYEFMLEDYESYFRMYLEDNYDLENEYVKSKLQED